MPYIGHCHTATTATPRAPIIFFFLLLSFFLPFHNRCVCVCACWPPCRLCLFFLAFCMSNNFSVFARAKNTNNNNNNNNNTTQRAAQSNNIKSKTERKSIWKWKIVFLSHGKLGVHLYVFSKEKWKVKRGLSWWKNGSLGRGIIWKLN